MTWAAVITFLERLFREARAVRENRGDLREDDVARRLAAEDEELEEIEEEEEEG